METASRHVQVMLPRPLAEAFDYRVPEGMEVQAGSIVEVPFGRTRLFGVVWGMAEPTAPREKIREISAVSDLPPLSGEMRAWLNFVAEYTLSPLGMVLALALSVREALSPQAGKMGCRLKEATEQEHGLVNPSPSVPRRGLGSACGLGSPQGSAIKISPQRRRVLDALAEGIAWPLHDLVERAGASATVVRGMVKAGLLEEVELPPETSAAVPPSPVQSLPFVLSPEQREAADALCRKVHGGYSATLLEGVTGSGKTEVYTEAIRAALGQGRQALVLLPEIVLTSQLLARFERNLGFAPTPWHSALTPKQRREHYRAIARGEVRLVVGARSALFLPYPKLGLIVVDEEHEASFKQEEGVIYHARDMAVARAHAERIPAVLVSASPSLETLHNVRAGKFGALHLRERHGVAELPGIRIVDMRREKLDSQHFLSAPLKEALAANLARGEQSLLYLNRRGYAPLTLCRKCGYRFQSPDSSAWMVLHWPGSRKQGVRSKEKNPALLPASCSLLPAPYLQCHHSGFTMPLPAVCPGCGEEKTFAACGPGVERLREEVAELLPQARIALMTSDTIASAEEGEKLVRTIEARELDILIGTQMVAKGHHFPALTLVGVVDADLGLEGGDLRAAERCFQVLQQVAGRAGREDACGQALIQSYLPETPLMQALTRGTREAFIAGEMAQREKAGMPPFTRMAALILRGIREEEVRNAAAALARNAPCAEGIRVFGPAPAPMLKLRGNFRYRLLMVGARGQLLQPLLRAWIASTPLPASVRLKVDVDPYSFM